MPTVVPNEVTPYVQQAMRDFPDTLGLLIWVYPFDEYHDWTFGQPCRVDEVFFGDWFMRAAVNQGGAFVLDHLGAELSACAARFARRSPRRKCCHNATIPGNIFPPNR